MNETEAEQTQANVVLAQQIQNVIAVIGTVAFLVYLGVEVIKVVFPKLAVPKGKS